VTWENDGLISLARLTNDRQHKPLAVCVSTKGAFPTLATAPTGNEIFVAWQQQESEKPAQIAFARIRMTTPQPQREDR
jgi:hypothetical protein